VGSFFSAHFILNGEAASKNQNVREKSTFFYQMNQFKPK
jgi:hypothetical protein